MAYPLNIFPIRFSAGISASKTLLVDSAAEEGSTCHVHISFTLFLSLQLMHLNIKTRVQLLAKHTSCHVIINDAVVFVHLLVYALVGYKPQ